MPVVLQVLPSLVTGGVERSTIEITQALVSAGWRAIVASAGGRLVDVVEREGGRHVLLPLDRKNPWVIWRNAARLAALVRSESVNIIHARSRAPAWSALAAARQTGAHFVTTYHGVYGEDLPLKRRYNSVMARGERVIAASQYVADVVVKRHGVDPGRVRIIPRGVNPKVFDPARVREPRIEMLRQSWGVPSDARVILLPGRVTTWKGQAVLLDAMGRLRQPGVIAVLAGSDQGRAHLTARLRRQAEQLGILEQVRIPGDCDDIPAAMMLADVVVHASIEPEAFGRVVIEAQAMARPVVASDLGGPVENVEHGVTGWRVRPGDPGALADLLRMVLALGDEERKRVGSQARKMVLRRCTVSVMQQATMEVYGELLGERGGAQKGVDHGRGSE